LSGRQTNVRSGPLRLTGGRLLACRVAVRRALRRLGHCRKERFQKQEAGRLRRPIGHSNRAGCSCPQTAEMFVCFDNACRSAELEQDERERVHEYAASVALGALRDRLVAASHPRVLRSRYTCRKMAVGPASGCLRGRGIRPHSRGRPSRMAPSRPRSKKNRSIELQIAGGRASRRPATMALTRPNLATASSQRGNFPPDWQQNPVSIWRDIITALTRGKTESSTLLPCVDPFSLILFLLGGDEKAPLQIVIVPRVGNMPSCTTAFGDN
jgi:hypothetical protein